MRFMRVRALSLTVLLGLLGTSCRQGPAAGTNPSASPAGTAHTTAGSPTPAGGAPSPVRLHVSATIKVGAANAVTYGEGSIWVAVSANDGSFGGWILRIDPATNKIIARIPVDAVPGWEVGEGGLTVGDGSVWVTGAVNAPGGLGSPGHGSDAVVIRIDPGTNRVVDTISLGGVFGLDVAIDKNGVWVLIDDDSNRPEVMRIDPSTDAVVATIPLGYHNSHFIFAVGGSILADGHVTNGVDVENSVLSRIDPATNRVVARLPFAAYVWPAAGDGAIWATSGTTLVRIDPATDRVVGAPLAVESTGDSLAVGDGGVWFLKPEDRNRVFRFNPATSRVDASVRLPAGTTPIAIAVAPGAIWVLNYEDSLTRIRISL